MKTLCWLLCSSLILLSACRRKGSAVPAAPENSAPPAVEQPAAPSSVPVAPTPAAPPSTATFDEHFGILSKGLLTFKRDKKRAPKDWQELIATGYLKQMPTPPPGKRYIFNPQSLDVHMVQQ